MKREAAAKSLAIARTKKPTTRVPGYDAFDWSNDRRVARWSFDPRHAAEAAWTYDEKNLYLCVRSVMDDTPMINGGNDVRTLFKTGDAIEFELRTQPNRDDKEVIPGDLRLLVSVFEKKPVAVLYRYKVPGTKQSVEFTSPVGVARIDQVEVLADAQIAIDRSPAGYNRAGGRPAGDPTLCAGSGQELPGRLRGSLLRQDRRHRRAAHVLGQPGERHGQRPPERGSDHAGHLGPVHHRGVNAMRHVGLSGPARLASLSLMLCSVSWGVVTAAENRPAAVSGGQWQGASYPRAAADLVQPSRFFVTDTGGSGGGFGRGDPHHHLCSIDFWNLAHRLGLRWRRRVQDRRRRA